MERGKELGGGECMTRVVERVMKRPGKRRRQHFAKGVGGGW
jgi:hypothetical protein